jgi:hypothetical protein
VDSVQVESERAEEWLARQKPDAGRHSTELVNTVSDLLQLHRCADPDIRRDRPILEEVSIALPEP